MWVILIFLLLSSSKSLQSQTNYISIDKHTGNWESPTTWLPTWNPPGTVVANINVTIYGYVTLNGSLTFTGNDDFLTVYDTLVIFGDLTIKNNSKLILRENSVLIIRGNLTLGNYGDVYSHSYLIVTGDFIKEGSLVNGNFHTDSPSDVFIGGKVQVGLDPIRYPVFTCPGPYEHQGCNYGNMDDLADSPISTFFQTSCAPVTITSSSSPMCKNEKRTLTGTPAGGIFTVVTGPGTINSGKLTATDAGTIVIKYSETGCQNSGTQNITVNPLPTPIINISDNSGTTINDGIICSGQTATLTASGGTNYSWSSGETTAVITKGIAGTYTVTATDANNCQNTSSSTITVNALPAISISITETSGILNNDGIICNGASATLTASGGTSYSWSSGESLSVITKSNAGTYTVTATDANNCQNTSSSTITVNALPSVAISIAETSGILANDGIICNGASATLTASGGTSYSWSSGESLSVITESNAGTYTVTATDANNCQNTSSSIITVNALPAVAITTAETSGILNNDGIICSGASATLTASGGTSYSWSSGESTSEITKGIAENYTVTATDANNCQNTSSSTIVVNALPALAISIAETSGNLNNDGIICSGASATLTASGGTSYSWSSGETTSVITKGIAGTYTVTATDANNCQNTSSSTITVNALPAVAISISETSGILNNDGIICIGTSTTLTASGGTSYSWSSGETLSVITKSNAGTYTVTATDANNCQNTSSSTITVNALPSVSISIAETSGNLNNDGIICNGAFATLTASGGTSYSWSSGETTSIITKDIAETYTVTAKDANNCQNTSSSTITVNALPTVAISIAETSGILNNDGIICNGASTTLTASGGTSYSWSSGETTSVITKGIAETYTVTATDANNCQNTSSSTITVNALPMVAISIAETSGILNNDGIICNGASTTLSASGGTSYSWSSGETTSEITKSNAETYTVTATDANNCPNTSSSTITVNAMPAVFISTAETSGNLNNDGIICNGASSTLTASGGTSYSWSSGETTSVITKGIAETYTVTATDANNCQNTCSSTITVNALPTVAISIAETSGILNNDGIICNGASTTLTASGGTSYSWSSGETTSVITKGISGTYTVTATDANNCQNTSSSTITVNALPAVDITTSETSGIMNNDGIICNGASATLTASGGVNYSWSSGETTSEIIKNNSGTYTLTITDGNNCTNTGSKIITVNSLPLVDISISETSGILNNDGIICSGAPTVLSTTGGVSYNWSSGETTSEITKNYAGTYTVSIVDENNCQNITSKTIIENPLPIANISITETSGILNNDGIICDNETATLSAAGGNNFIWSTGETDAEIQVSQSGNYSVTVSDINQCLNTSNVEIIITKTIAEAGADTDVCGMQYSLQATGSGTGTWTVTEGAGVLTFSPNENDALSTISTNKYGSYRLTWTVENENCTASSDVNITFHEPPIANAGLDQDLNYAFSTKLNAELTSDLMGQWSILSGSGSIYDIRSPITMVSNLSAGDNSFLWTVSSDKCSDTDTILVNVSDLFVPNVITPDGDNKNNFFVIKDIEKNSPVELIIFNRWGNEVYKNSNYNNTWDGRNNNNDVLPDDTYFYILKLASGKIIKSFVVIKK